MKIKPLGSSAPNWQDLQHAYGSASDVPALLQLLTSRHQGQRRDAVNELLYSRAYHQGDVFSSTHLVIRSVLPLLSDTESAALEIYPGIMLPDEIIHFCRICAEADAKTPEMTKQITDALIEGLNFFSSYVSSFRRQTSGDAIWLVAFCERMKAQEKSGNS